MDIPVRLALLWHDTVITERRITRGPVTVGEALDNTLSVPPAADLGAHHPLLEAGDGAWMLFTTPGMGGARAARRPRARSGRGAHPGAA
jgi:hypothetical protein